MEEREKTEQRRVHVYWRACVLKISERVRSPGPELLMAPSTAGRSNFHIFKTRRNLLTHLVILLLCLASLLIVQQRLLYSS
jgi:hypothetical protein